MRETDLVNELLERDFDETEAYFMERRKSKTDYKTLNPRLKEEIEKKKQEKIKEQKETITRNALRLASGQRGAASNDLRIKMALHAIKQVDVAFVLGKDTATVNRWFGERFEKKKEILEEAVDAIIEARNQK